MNLFMPILAQEIKLSDTNIHLVNYSNQRNVDFGKIRLCKLIELF